MDFSLLDANGGQGERASGRSPPLLAAAAALLLCCAAVVIGGPCRLRCAREPCLCMPHSVCTHRSLSNPLTPLTPPLTPPLARPGWDLAVKLLQLKNEFNRGRLSCSQALRHPFLLLPA